MLRHHAIATTILLVLVPACKAETPRDLFEEAVRQDLGSDTALAFGTYLKAARLGLPEAEFNVAVMLDSGRGVRADVVRAAAWYARAAAHGNRRAAYNLALLYSNGEGVPRNEGISNAWFAASGLPASASRRDTTHAKEHGAPSTLSAPTPVAPEGGATIEIASGKIEIVWTAEARSEPVRYVVELRSGDANDRYDTVSTPVATSSLLVDVPAKGGRYAWRVFAVSKTSAQYVPCAWTTFQLSGDISPRVAN